MPSAPLILALANLVDAEPRPAARTTALALRAGAATPLPQHPATHLAEGIRAACRLPGAHPVAALILRAMAHLPWADSPAASLQPTSLQAIKSIVELLGPDGPIPCVDLRFGLFYQAPGSYYPLHAHEAAETYTLLAGSALWQAGDARLSPGPGEAIHHPPQMPHAMRAGPEGFLAIWRWSGDIGFDSYHMLPDAEAA